MSKLLDEWDPSEIPDDAQPPAGPDPEVEENENVPQVTEVLS